jgi:nicotinate-nucleotide--dimethylbenzimidazole phosphoribosyltransferase
MSSVKLDKLAGLIEWPDDDARTRAVQLLRERRRDPLGRLGDSAAWLAAVTGQCPPPVPCRTKLMVFTDDGTAPELAQRVIAGSLRSLHSSRADGGSDDVWTALAGGAVLADAEADYGTDLILLAAPSDAARIPAATLVAFVTESDPQSVASTLRGDQEWMRTVSGVRDNLRRLRRAPDDPLSLLDGLGGTQIAHLTGVFLGAAARRTPIVFEGAACAAAAVMAARISLACGAWFMPAHADSDPAGAAAMGHLGRAPLLDVGMMPGDGIAVSLAASMLETAAAMLAGEPAASEPPGPDPLSDPLAGEQTLS